MTSYTLGSVATLMDERDDRAASADLSARVAAGDRQAFLIVYRAHFAELRAFGQRLLGSATVADDLVHDVFLALPAALARFRGECSLRSFLFSIAVRSAQRYVRAAKRHRAAAERLLGEPSPPSGTAPDERAEQRELALMLSTALDALPVDQRVAFVLCELEELTSSEVAQIVGANAGTVRARVFHAKKKLRERLTELAPAAWRAEWERTP